MTRQELYNLVWQMPAVHVARQLGMSIGALRGLCVTYNVPLPPAGYWTKVAFGKEIDKPALPAIAPSLLSKVELALRRLGRAAIDITDAQIASHQIDFSSLDADERHPLTREIASELARCRADADGFVTYERQGDLFLRFGVDSHGRVLAFINMLIQVALAAGLELARSAEGLLSFDGAYFAARVYETRERHGRPSGRLCLEIYDPRSLKWSARNLVGHWHDRKGTKVEDSVRAAIAGVKNVTPLINEVYAAHARQVAEREDLARQQRRNAVVERRNAYIGELGRLYAELTGLKALRERLMSVAPSRGASDRVVQHLALRIDELERTFRLEVIEAEFERRDLFGPSDGLDDMPQPKDR